MKVKILGTEECPFCTKAKLLCDLKGIEYEFELKTVNDIKALGYRTVPQIWVNGEHVGGFTDFEKVVKSGELL